MTEPEAGHPAAHTDHHHDLEHDLDHHGDRDGIPGLVDLAVNVRPGGPPDWLAEALARPRRWAAYPDPAPAREALAAHLGVPRAMVLPTAGGAEAFTLLARGLMTRRPLVVHPQFTEPEQALRLAGHRPQRHLLRPEEGFRLVPGRVPAEADLVVVGNPTNPTGVLHPRTDVLALRRPGRVLVVDEAFMDAVPGQPESVIGPDMTGLLVVRSLTKTWSLAGLRAGFVVGDPRLVAALAGQQPPWSVSTPALDAMVAVSTPEAAAQAELMARRDGPRRQALVEAVVTAGLSVAADSRAPFLLVDTSALGEGSQREPLARLGFAVRRGETFPGLGPHHLRLAVRDEAISRSLGRALASLPHAPSARATLPEARPSTP